MATSKLPKGINPIMSRSGTVKYQVRFMLDGAYINLGMFPTLTAAKDAKAAFMIADITRQQHDTGSFLDLKTAAINEVVSDSWPISDRERWTQALDQLPSPLLSTERDTITSDGTIIPKLFVEHYLNTLYNSLTGDQP